MKLLRQLEGRGGTGEEIERLTMGKKFWRTAYEDKEPSSWWEAELDKELQNIPMCSLEQRGEIAVCVLVVSSCSSHSECVLLDKCHLFLCTSC